MRKAKRLVSVGLICAMLAGMSITSSAAVVPPDNESKCNYDQFMGINEYQKYDEGSHGYYVTDAQGNTTVKSCPVTAVLRREVWKCHCGNINYVYHSTILRHGQCGLGDVLQ